MDGDELVADVEGAADRLADAMSEKIKQVKEGEAAAKEAAKEAKAKEKEAKEDKSKAKTKKEA